MKSEENVLGESKITNGGQITLNKSIRTKSDVSPGDYIVYMEPPEGCFGVLLVPADLRVRKKNTISRPTPTTQD